MWLGVCVCVLVCLWLSIACNRLCDVFCWFWLIPPNFPPLNSFVHFIYKFFFFGIESNRIICFFLLSFSQRTWREISEVKNSFRSKRLSVSGVYLSHWCLWHHFLLKITPIFFCQMLSQLTVDYLNKIYRIHYQLKYTQIMSKNFLKLILQEKILFSIFLHRKFVSNEMTISWMFSTMTEMTKLEWPRVRMTVDLSRIEMTGKKNNNVYRTNGMKRFWRKDIAQLIEIVHELTWTIRRRLHTVVMCDSVLWLWLMLSLNLIGFDECLGCYRIC